MSKKVLACGSAFTAGVSLALFLGWVANWTPMLMFLLKGSVLIGAGITLTLWCLRRFWGERNADLFVLSAIVFLSSISVSLLVLEFMARTFLKDITTTPDNRSYFARRWASSHVRLNKWGFRERNFELSKGSNVYRIAVIGDSFTFGQGIDEQDRFTNLLERRLRETKGHYEVLNFGRPGAETIHHVAILKNVVLKARPDFLLLQWYINDFEGSNKNDRPKVAPLLPSSLHSLLHQSSALYYLVSQQWVAFQTAVGLSSYTYVEYLARRFGDPQSPDSLEAGSALKHFIELCEAEDIPVGIVLFPHIGAERGDAYPFDYLHARVLDTCSQRGITCLDLRAAFAPYAYKELWANRFDSHPGSLANRLAAERLFAVFGSVWLSDLR